MSTGEYVEDFRKGAKSNLELAREALPTDAFIHSFWTLENLLKAVLVKSGNYEDKPLSRGGDRHHDCTEHFKKLQRLELLSSEVLDELDSQMTDMLTVSILDESGTCHMDSPPPQTHRLIGDIRYFDASTYIGFNEARSKVEKVESIYELLEPHI